MSKEKITVLDGSAYLCFAPTLPGGPQENILNVAWNWQPVETAPTDERVLVAVRGAVTVGYMNSTDDWEHDIEVFYGDKPTHWMPLPEPPNV